MAFIISWYVHELSDYENTLVFSESTDGTVCPGVDSASKNEYQENS